MGPANLADRLRGIITGGPLNRPAVLSNPIRGAAVPDAVEVGTALGGRRDGACFVVEHRVEPGTNHGSSTIAAVASQIGEALPSARLLSVGSEVRAPLLFFDLETTGLSGGAGTYAFLIGCGWFEDDGAFLTRQYMLTQLAEEPAVLDSFRRDLARAGALVSFNGKTFDAPVLETRYLYHRRSWPGADLPHIDVLHPARRFWGGRRDAVGAAMCVGPAARREPAVEGGYKRPPVQSPAGGQTVPPLRSAEGGHAGPPLRVPEAGCSLAALEERVLGNRRAGDVPGFEIPARYFQYLRSGDPRPLAAVLEHNRLDLLSLAAMTARLLSLVHHGCSRVAHATEALSLGRVYAAAGFDERAESAWRLAIALAQRDREAAWVEIDALRLLARAARRRRRFDEAAEWWRALLRTGGCHGELAAEAHQALAIHHEHRLRDLKTARSYALQILNEPLRPARNHAVQHRLARLERKMGLLEF